MPRLLEATKRFIRKDLTIDKLHLYYLPAKQLFREKILQKIEKVLSDNILEVKETSPILGVVDPDFLGSCIVHSRQSMSVSATTGLINFNRHVESLVLRYCQLHSSLLSPEQFRRLTDKHVLPCVATVSGAFKLMELEHKIVGTLRHEDSDLKTRCFATFSEALNQVTLLNSPGNQNNSLIDFFKSQQPREVMDSLLQGHLYNKCGNQKDELSVVIDKNKQLAAEIKLLKREKEELRTKLCQESMRTVSLMTSSKKQSRSSPRGGSNVSSPSDAASDAIPRPLFSFETPAAGENPKAAGDGNTPASASSPFAFESTSSAKSRFEATTSPAVPFVFGANHNDDAEKNGTMESDKSKAPTAVSMKASASGKDGKASSTQNSRGEVSASPGEKSKADGNTTPDLKVTGNFAFPGRSDEASTTPAFKIVEKRRVVRAGRPKIESSGDDAKTDLNETVSDPSSNVKKAAAGFFGLGPFPSNDESNSAPLHAPYPPLPQKPPKLPSETIVASYDFDRGSGRFVFTKASSDGSSKHEEAAPSSKKKKG